ncbi:permease [Sulfurimonas sp. HSL3-7]|uniref:permease n=1 Tax=Sulfonitrofixus jiaomeiensis TaxID=3131938 RepID=UPI0031F73855
MWKDFVDTLVYEIMGMAEGDRLADALNFFIYDSVKIAFLLVTIIFIISFLRSYMNTEKVRAYLSRKHRVTGHVFAALFGIITPFCSCSAIPLFLGFLQARIPLGITFSYLISAPLNNEIAIAMLFGLFGWEITAIYIGFGLLVAIIGGLVIGMMKVERYILIPVTPLEGEITVPEEANISLKVRAKEAWKNTRELLIKVMPYVVAGVGVGAFIHGYVPQDMIVAYAGQENPFAVIVAVVMGIPMYSNAAGIIPMIEALTLKGMAMGTALAFMMAVTALSLPEAIILKKLLHTKLIALFFAIVGSGIIVIGYLFNAII